MKIKTIVLYALLVITTTGFSQEDSAKAESPKFKDKIFYQISAGMMVSDNETDGRSYHPSVDAVVGYRFARLLQPGISIGYDEYDYFTAMPISLYLAGDILKSDNTPFYYLRGGQSKFFKDDSHRFESIESGEMFEAGVGYNWKFSNVRLRLSVGWKHQTLKTEDRNIYWYWEDFAASSVLPASIQKTNWEMERVIFKFGLLF